MRYQITDERWAVMGPLVDRAKRNRQGQRPDRPDRLFCEALRSGGRTGIPWRDLPGACGAWDAVDDRFRRWVHSGRLRALFELLTAAPPPGAVRRVSIDSTTVRAHPHAAGGRRKNGAGPHGRPRSRASAAAGAGGPPR